MKRRRRRKNHRLVAAMAKTGLTGRQLAAEAGLHPTTVSEAVNLRVVPKPETARRIAAALRSTPAGLGFTSETGGAS